MELHIGELASTVDAADSQLLARLVEETARRVREDLAYEQRVADERSLRPAVSSGEEGA